ncbi:pyocin activator PrtN family protein [Vibrio parahaemolyticus]
MNVPFSTPTTATLLAAKFNNEPLIALADVADEYLGLELSTVKRKARTNELPFPVLRLYDSQKAPWWVKFEHLVEYVERTAANSHSDWLRMQC